MRIAEAVTVIISQHGFGCQEKGPIKMQTLKPTAKSSEAVTLHFTPAPDGTTAEIENSIQIPIVGRFVSEDGSCSLLCCQTESDYKWQLNCLIDRLFHPYKYAKEFNEDVHEHIRYLIKWLSEHCKPELKENILTELNELVKYVSELDGEDKHMAELYLKDYIKYCQI